MMLPEATGTGTGTAAAAATTTTTTTTNNSQNTPQNNSKLDPSRVHLVGHKEELQQLNDVYRNVLETDTDGCCHAVLIGGVSGCGKSTLVEQFCQRNNLLCMDRTTHSINNISSNTHSINNNNNNIHNSNNNSNINRKRKKGIFGCGKFDQLFLEGGGGGGGGGIIEENHHHHQRSGQHPYSALVDAMNEICTLIEPTPELQFKLQQGLGRDYSIISNLLYNFNVLFGNSPPTIQRTESEIGRYRDSLLHQSLRGEQGRGGEGRSSDDDDDEGFAVNDEDRTTPVGGYINGFTRLKIAIQAFLRTLASIQPIVLFLDDLQWADTSTLELLAFLLENGDPTRNDKFHRVGTTAAAAVVMDCSNHTQTTTTTTTTMAHGGGGGASSRSVISTVSSASSSSPPPNYRLMIIGCYRNNEIHPDHALAQGLVTLGEISPHNVTQLSVDVLSQNDLNEFISQLMQVNDSEQTIELTRVIHRKTNGNPFFTLQFLDALTQTGLLQKSIFTFQWEYNIQRIQSETNLTSNVVEIVSQKIQRLEETSQEVLKIGSCLGNRFDATIIEKVLQFTIPIHESSSSPSSPPISPISSTLPPLSPIKMSVREALRAASVEQLIDQVGSSSTLYRFSHDRIQQAAYQLILTGDDFREETNNKTTPPHGLEKWETLPPKRVEYHYRIGTVLIELYRTSLKKRLHHGNEWQLLVGTEQLNLARSYILDDATKQYELAKLNLAAARMVKHKSAFCAAVEFLNVARDLLGPNQWEDTVTPKYRRMALRVHMSLVEMEFCSGHADISLTMIDEVLTKSRCQTLEEQLAAYSLKTEILYSQRRHLENFPIIRQAVKEVGIKVPSFSLFRTLVCILKTKKLLKRYTADEIVNRKTTVNATHLAVMDLLMNGRTSAFFMNMKTGYVIFTTLLIRMSLKWGLSTFSPAAFAAWGVVLMNLGDVQGAQKYSEIARRVNDRLQSRRGQAKFKVIDAGFLKHLHRPLSECTQVVTEGYTVGMETGDLAYGFLCANISLGCRFWLSYPLGPLLADSKLILQEMKDYKIEFTNANLSIFLQLVANLATKSNPTEPNDPAILQGEFIPDFNQFTKEVHQNYGEEDFLFRQLNFFSMWIAFLFDDIERAKRFAIWSLSASNKDFPLFYIMFYPLIRGMIWLDLVKRSTKKRRYHMRLAQKEFATLKRWAKHGFINVPYMLSLLHAEIVSVTHSHDFEYVADAYDKAIVMCSKSGFSLFAAIANERAARYCFEIDTVQATFYLDRSVALMEEWGAHGRVEFLGYQYGMDESTLNDVKKLNGSYLTGRNKLETATTKHKKADWMRRGSSIRSWQGRRSGAVSRLFGKQSSLNDSQRSFSNSNSN